MEAGGKDKLLVVKGTTKAFGENRGKKGAGITVDRGEVLALIGGNGAGKSTLMKIIMGIYQPDGGQIFIDGKETQMTNPTAALTAGVYMVPQEPMLFPNMNVLENITMGFKESTLSLKSRLTKIMSEIGWEMDLSRKASTLSIAEQTLVEILRGLLRNSKILILDEPTSALTFDEVESFFKVVKDLRARGIGIIYITHRLAEVFDIATHVSIMRDGQITLEGPVENFTREMLVQGLLPPDATNEKELKSNTTKIDYTHLKPVFELQNLSGYGFQNISLKVYPGEILGIAGVVGAGRTELVSTIFGRDKVLSGKVILDGKDVTGKQTKEILSAGINYVPEDRHLHGLFKISSIAANTTSALLKDSVMGRLLLNKKNENQISDKYIGDFRIKTMSHEEMAGSLSGGNQQKVVISRALSTKPKLVIMDEPTRGIDAAARGDVYSIIHHLREEGVAVLLVSSDMEEIMELCDRTVTVFQGHINGEFSGSEINQDNLTAASFGLETKA